MEGSDHRLRGGDGSEITIDRPLLSAFGGRLAGRAIWPGSEGYDEARRLWNGMHDMRPGVIVRCRSAADVRACVDLWCLGGAFGRVGPGETAFGDRDVAYMVNYEANWDDPGADRANISWARGSLAEAQRLRQARAYLNFAGLGEEGEQLVRASVGANYPRLQAVKAAYDPHNLFRTNFNVTPFSSAR